MLPLWLEMLLVVQVWHLVALAVGCLVFGFLGGIAVRNMTEKWESDDVDE